MSGCWYTSEFFLFHDIPNCGIGYAQWLCTSCVTSLFSQLKWLAFLPQTSLWSSCLFILYNNRYSLHSWNSGIKSRVDISGQQETLSLVFQYFWYLKNGWAKTTSAMFWVVLMLLDLNIKEWELKFWSVISYSFLISNQNVFIQYVP